MVNPSTILDLAFEQAASQRDTAFIADPALADQIRFICRNRNRATTRLLLACTLAKIHQPDLDIRRPYTQIDEPGTYSGRMYDEQYISPFIHAHQLPCNPTTAFLTPALRNRNLTLVPGMALEGQPKAVYDAALNVLAAVHTKRVSAEKALAEIVRCLLIYRDERQADLNRQLAALPSNEEAISLSSEGIVTLITQHLSSPRASRLPVLVVAAAYHTAQTHLGERLLPLHAHTAADRQTGALGDLEITLIDNDEIVTSYEMKMKRVTVTDIDHALQKIANSGKRIDNYIFITTEMITDEVRDYAATMYDQTGGIEIVVLDCINFLRHFLHLFHRLRMNFLDAYQELVLAEPESAVRQELKTAFLALREAAESG